jgi:prepilin-type N-terminal cleavage/methylation domain-containing protein
MRHRAFTLVETLIVLALIGLVGGIVAVATEGVIEGARKPSPYEVLRKAVDTAWYAAATGNSQVALVFDADASALVLARLASTQAPEPGMETFPFDDARVRSVRFLRASGAGLPGGRDAAFPRLLFSPWGGATPAVIEMDLDGAVFRYALEVFSGALESLSQ